MMKESLWHRLDQVARNLTPFGLTLALILLSILPTQIPGYSRIAPLLAVMAIYHWTLYRPQLLPALAVFALGLFQDLLSGAPAGLHVLVFLSVHGAVATQRRFLAGKPFPIYWFGFALIALGAAAEIWLLASLWHLSLLDYRPALFQFLVTVGLFPLLAWVFLRWQGAFLQRV